MSDSPCKTCRHCTAVEVTSDYWAGTQYDEECEEDAPADVFMSEWGCFRYWEAQDE